MWIVDHDLFPTNHGVKKTSFTLSGTDPKEASGLGGSFQNIWMKLQHPVPDLRELLVEEIEPLVGWVVEAREVHDFQLDLQDGRHAGSEAVTVHSEPGLKDGFHGLPLNGLVKSRWYAPMRTTDPS